ncbi:methionyl aminopeptidase [Dysgonomonas sp. PFB1-18]|uniref:type I methionyl aminopeptidase n=1 Tax=unclassified Dysgonomonas TaxID=2630389 RepID=UPI002476EFD1|nr:MULTISPECIES: type I methionyl aminopeptidase [unclassified Dysgonomonas]MDH6307322.1 methionyl aminopeptidase [Dysgonomonas sp. PF1-14]MDH6337240.1 methionyl aminopeptidase [Dysgonomonas sp. PF1-16]MDH6379164.1 methionyl aminopeptidase [Dysgonomonas sp. PFB1-18]MDH6396198.1 methionyl aminopeptidase [Dysgonomonas sp. PF1-23]
MIFLKTDEEIELMREANRLVGMTQGELAKLIKPGITTLYLDKIAEEFIRDHGAVPSFLGYNGFPYSLCISVNENVVHGFPSEYVLQDGDIISVDCGTEKNGFCGDSAYTFCVGEVAEDVKKLLRTTKEALYLGIEKAVEGNRVGDIGDAVQTYCEKRGYSVVRELVGHGIGRKMHEAPEVPNYGRRGVGPMLKKGMCIAIEPMINMGSKNVVFESDGWTVRTKDRKPSAHFEHTVAIRQGKADILSTFEFVEAVLGDNAI